MLRITVSECDRHGGDLTCMYAVACGQRTGENHHTLLQVSFATWAGLFFSVQSSTILLYLTLALVKGMLCLFTFYTGPKNYRKLSYLKKMAYITFRFGYKSYDVCVTSCRMRLFACFLRVWWRWRWRCSIND